MKRKKNSSLRFAGCPQPISKSIEAKIDDFLYSKDNNVRKKKLLSKHREELPKDKGGIGRWDMEDRANCFLAAHIENILHNDPIYRESGGSATSTHG